MNDLELDLLVEQSKLLVEESRKYLDRVWAHQNHYIHHIAEMRACIAITREQDAPHDPANAPEPPADRA